MRSRQQGITFIGWIFLLAPLAILLFAGLKLLPIYLMEMKVSTAVEQVAQNYKGETALNPAQVQREIQQRFDVEDIDDLTGKDITVARDGDQWYIEADYTREAELFGGISLSVHFDKRANVE